MSEPQWQWKLKEKKEWTAHDVLQWLKQIEQDARSVANPDLEAACTAAIASVTRLAQYRSSDVP